jgi:FkbM family methyltransferase
MNKEIDYIFDFGANSGQNLEYYLARANKVIAVEANPKLCEDIQNEFKEEIFSNKLVVANFVLTDSIALSGKEVDFYINIKSSAFSQFQTPKKIDDFKKIKVPAITPSKIVKNFLSSSTNSFYIKIDLEGFDSQVLKDLFKHQIYPDFVSVEAHTIDGFASLINSEFYKSFTLIDGSKVPKYQWITDLGNAKNFRRHSAGPFGKDIVEKWFDAKSFYRLLAFENLGWKDIHASKLSNNVEESLSARFVVKKSINLILITVYYRLIPYKLRKSISRLRYLFKFSKLKNVHKISRLKYVFRTLFSDPQ